MSVGKVRRELQKMFGGTLSCSTVQNLLSLTAKSLKRFKVKRLSDKSCGRRSSSPELMPIDSCVFLDKEYFVLKQRLNSQSDTCWATDIVSIRC